MRGQRYALPILGAERSEALPRSDRIVLRCFSARIAPRCAERGQARQAGQRVALPLGERSDPACLSLLRCQALGSACAWPIWPIAQRSAAMPVGLGEQSPITTSRAHLWDAGGAWRAACHGTRPASRLRPSATRTNAATPASQYGLATGKFAKGASSPGQAAGPST